MADSKFATKTFPDGNGLFRTISDNGYTPVPIVPAGKNLITRDGKERPGGKTPGAYDVSSNTWKGYPGWQDLLTTKASNQQISRWESWVAGGRPNLGILTGNIIGVDIDILGEPADETQSLAFHILGSTPLIRYGNITKRMLIYRLRDDKVCAKMKSRSWHEQVGGVAIGGSFHVEVLGKGQQFVAFGTHPSTMQPYRWVDQSPLTVSVTGIPVTTVEKLSEFLAAFDAMCEMKDYIGSKTSQTTQDATPNQTLIDARGYIEQALPFLHLDLADDYHEWINIGMALKAAIPDDNLALSLWHDFSSRSDKYDPTIVDDKWCSLRPSRIGAGTIYKHAADNGWVPPEQVIAAPDFPIALNRMRVIQRVDPIEIPPRRWVLGHYLLRGQVTTLVAPGSVGKSTLTLAWAAAIASNRNITNALPSQGNVWVINNEDDHDELARRYLAVKLAFDIPWEELENRVFFTGGAANPFVIAKRGPNGSLNPAPDLLWAIENAKAHNIAAIIVDPLVETHAADENDNNQMQQVMAFYRRIAQEVNCAVCVVHHTAKPPGGSSEGFAGNANAARGASAVVNTARIGLTLFDMSIQDAEKYGIAESVRNRYVRLDDAKMNLSLRSYTAKWFYRESIPLGNGDEVGVLRPVTLTDRSTALTDDLTTRIFEYMEDHFESPLIDAARYILSDQLYHDEKESTIRRRVKEAFVIPRTNGKFTISYARRETDKIKDWVVKILENEVLSEN